MLDEKNGAINGVFSCNLVSVLIITRNRSEELFDTISNIQQQSYANIELIVLENGSDSQVVEHNKRRIQEYGNIHYVVLSENKGVSGGRNVALSQARGKYIVEVDDDAIFEYVDSIEKVVEFFERHPLVGIQAFKITNFFSKQIVPQEYPFRDKNRDPLLPGPCTWFIGAGHAFRRDMIGAIGTYRDFFPWGSEEQDLSMRALENDFEIYYNPRISILHKKSPKARIRNQSEFASIALKNRVKVAMLNLPILNVFSFFLIRGTQLSLRYKDISIPLRSLILLFKDMTYIRMNRKVLSRKTLRKMSELKGQLYF